MRDNILTIVIGSFVYLFAFMYYQAGRITAQAEIQSIKCGEEYIPPCNKELISRDVVDKCYIEED